MPPKPQLYSGFVKNMPVLSSAPARSISKPRPGQPHRKWKSTFVDKKTEPAGRIAAMPDKYKGKCCGGTKVWNDGNGSHDNNGKLFYECNGCRQRLPQPEAAATTTE